MVQALAGMGGIQVPVVEVVIGQQAGARGLQVLLADLRDRPGAQRGLIAADDGGQDDQRPDRVFAAATARAAWSSSACTHPSDGRVPDIDAMMSAHRSTGTWCITSRNTHHACMFSP
jgi:hypothetical protein